MKTTSNASPTSIVVLVDKHTKLAMKKIANKDGRPLGNYLRKLMEKDIKEHEEMEKSKKD